MAGVVPLAIVLMGLSVMMTGALGMRMMVPVRRGMGTVPLPFLVKWGRPLDLLEHGMQHQGLTQRRQVSHG